MKTITFTNVDPGSILILKLALLHKKSQYEKCSQESTYDKDVWTKNAFVCDEFLIQL